MDTVSLKIIPVVETPDIISRIKRRGWLLKNFESKGFHIAYQYNGTQVWVVLRSFLNTRIPDFQDLFTCFLNISKWVVIAEGENGCVAP